MNHLPLKPFLLYLCCLSLTIGANAREPRKREFTQQSQIPSLQTQLIDQHVSELMADKVNKASEIASEGLADLEYLSYDELLDSEALRFPADELYDSSWDTCWVNPFRSKEVNIPDSFNVDCRAFSIPIDGDIKVTSKYGPRRRRMHRGIDLKVQVGDTIRTSFSGKVRIKGFERRGYGYYLVIRHPNGLETIYGHLSKFLVSENEIVKTGQAIALGGNTGRSTGSHLHFETRFLGQAINPSDIIDFEKGEPHQPFYTFQKGKSGTTNVYTSTSERIVYHRVKKGETLGQIALKYRTTVNELCRLNGLSRKSTLRIGQSIRCGTTAPAVRNTKQEKDNAIAANESVAVQKVEAFHEVQAKETLSTIAKKYGTTVDALCRLNNIQSTVPLRIGQRICYRSASKSSIKNDKESTNVAVNKPVETKQDEKVSQPVYHHVSQGETLSKIASLHGTTVDELCRLNGLSKNSKLRIGQKLRCNVDVQTVAKAEKQIESSTSQEKNKPVYYRIKQGDTLGSIARKHGMTITKLCEMNNITKTTILKVGRSLRCS